MRFLSLFSGIEAASAAWAPLGWTCVAVSEIDKFANEVLRCRHPNVRNLGDVTKITETDIASLGDIDVVIFGSPCQDLSIAGKRKGLDGARSGLFFDAMRILAWSRFWCGTRFAVWENVPGAFSSNKGCDFAAVVDALSGLDGTPVPPKGWGTEGCAVGPEAMVEWAVLDAQYFGVAQRRRRVFAVADFGNWAGREPILLEPQGLRGDSAPSRKAGEGSSAQSAISVALRGREGGGTAELGDEVQNCLRASSGGGDKPHVLCLAHGQGGAEVASERSPTLTCNHEAPIVVHGTQDPCVSTETAFALGRNNGGENVVAFSCKDDGGERVAMAIQAGALRTNPESGPDGVGVQADRAYTLEARSEVQCVQIARQVRRLTPVECERLQGFPDGHTDVRAGGTPDGPRYKAIGNSMALPVIEWIGRRIENAVLFGE